MTVFFFFFILYLDNLYVPKNGLEKGKSMFEFKVKELRLKKGMKQSTLVKKSGVSRTVISQIENGAARDIRLSTLAALAYILECPTDKLYEYTPERSQSDVLDGPIY